MALPLPPVAQFSLDGQGGGTTPPPQQNRGGMPPVVQYSISGQSTSTPQQSSENPIVSGAKAVGNFLFPAVGDVYHDIKGDNTKTGLQQLGDVGTSVLPFIPGLGEAGEAARGVEAVGSGLLGTVGKGAATGYGLGVSQNLSEGKGFGQSLAPNLNTVGGAITGGALNGVLGKLGTGANGLRKSATEDITGILSPTTKENKQITQKIAPRLAAEGPMAMTREGLLEKYQANMGKVGDKIEAEYEICQILEE